MRVHPRNPDRVWFSSTPVLVSSDGGRTARTATQGIHVDHHAMWIDPGDPEHMVVGDDGGISITWDGGGNYDFSAVLPIAQFYDVSYDFETPYNVCAGAQDNGSWCGPSRRKSGPVTNAYWFTIAGGDGFYTAQHPQESCAAVPAALPVAAAPARPRVGPISRQCMAAAASDTARSRGGPGACARATTGQRARRA